MAQAFPRVKSTVEKIFDNIIFLEDIFGDRDDEEIPQIPVLELARSFELSTAAGAGVGRKGPRERKAGVHYRITNVAGWFIVSLSGKAANNEPLKVKYIFKRWLAEKGMRVIVNLLLEDRMEDRVKIFFYKQQEGSDSDMAAAGP